MDNDAIKERTKELLGDIGTRIRYFGKRKASSRKLFIRLALAAGALSASNAFFVGASQICPEQDWLGLLAFGLSSLVAVFTVIDNTLRPKDRWIQNMNALNEAYDLRERIEDQLAYRRILTEAQLRDFKQEFRALERGFFAGLASIYDQEPYNAKAPEVLPDPTARPRPTKGDPEDRGTFPDIEPKAN